MKTTTHSRLVIPLFVAALALPVSGQTPAQLAELSYRKGQAAEQAGDPEAARKAYTDALKANPNHPHARYSLGQLKITGPALAAKGREMKFGAIMIPELKLDEAPLKDSLEALQVLVEKASEDKITPNFILQDPQGALSDVKITLVLKNTPAKAALQYILEMAGAKARHDEHAIIIAPN